MLHILPFEHLAETDLDRKEIQSSKRELSFLESRPYCFVPSGRRAISIILDNLDLEPVDEVYITNSTGQTYISACVTCTVFNFCQPSRELSDKTRAIFVIHENGVPHPKIHDLLAEGKRRGIPLIEDCAHTFDSKVQGSNVGTLGDYALFSLPKIFPLKEGGILSGVKLPVFKLKPYEIEMVKSVENGFNIYSPLLNYFSARRRENFIALSRFFSGFEQLFHLEEGITPYYFGVYLTEAWRIRRNSREVEWGSTLIDDLLLIPTNPLIKAEKLIRTVKEVIGKYL